MNDNDSPKLGGRPHSFKVVGQVAPTAPPPRFPRPCLCFQVVLAHPQTPLIFHPCCTMYRLLNTLKQDKYMDVKFFVKWTVGILIFHFWLGIE